MIEINSEISYNEALKEIWALMQKDEEHLVECESARIAKIVKAGKGL